MGEVGLCLYRIHRSHGQVQTRQRVYSPQYNSIGLFTYDGTGWVVTRNNFDEIREFTEFSTAKLYIESLFALEHGG